jgi:hypothetical protein
LFPPPSLESLPPLPLYSLVVADGEDTTGSFHNDDHAANEAKGFVLLVAVLVVVVVVVPVVPDMEGSNQLASFSRNGP